MSTVLVPDIIHTTSFAIKIFQDVVSKIIKKYKGVENWKSDYRISKAVPILTDVITYLDETLNEYMETHNLKSADCKVSLKDICENVPEFDKLIELNIFFNVLKFCESCSFLDFINKSELPIKLITISG